MMEVIKMEYNFNFWDLSAIFFFLLVCNFTVIYVLLPIIADRGSSIIALGTFIFAISTTYLTMRVSLKLVDITVEKTDKDLKMKKEI